MNQIQGYFQIQNNHYYCLFNQQNIQFNVLISPLYRQNAVPGDQIIVSINDPTQWEVIDTTTGNIIEFTKPNTNYQSFIPSKQYQNLLEIILSIQQREYKTIIPTGKIESFVNPQNIQSTGFVENNFFFSDDINFPVLPTNRKMNKFQRVNGIYNRQTGMFEVMDGNTNHVHKKEMTYDMDDSESLVIFCQDIDETNTQYVSADTLQQTIVEQIKDGVHFDLRNRRIFTIDSTQTKMRDDAIHCCFLNNEKIEIGLHCIDFTNDLSTVDLTQIISNWNGADSKRIFTKSQSDQLSLNKGKDCYACSILCTIDIPTNTLENLRIGKSRIRITSNLTFNQFHDIINGNQVDIETMYYPKEQLIDDCKKFQLISNKTLLPYLKGYKLKGENEGDNVIRIFGEFFGRIVGDVLYRNYGNLALVKQFKLFKFASFRSPLRKLGDICVIKQLESVICHYNNQDMILYVCTTEENFKKILQLFNN